MNWFTLDKLLFVENIKLSTYGISLTPLIKATDSINSSTLSISTLNLLKYVRVDSPSCWATLKSSVEVLLVGILVLKHATNFSQRSLKPSIEFGSRLLYQARADPPKVEGNILHIESVLDDQLQATTHILHMFPWVG